MSKPFRKVRFYHFDGEVMKCQSNLPIRFTVREFHEAIGMVEVTYTRYHPSGRYSSLVNYKVERIVKVE